MRSAPRATPRGRLLLITGPPGVGKTTVIRKVAEALAGQRPGGFYTAEIRVRGERRGFRLVTFDGREIVMAHVDVKSAHRVGKYGVDVTAIDEVAESTLAVEPPRGLYLVDEIGRMECFSARFVLGMRELLESPRTVVATIARKGVGFIAEVKARQPAELLEVTRTNRDALPQRIVAWICPVSCARRAARGRRTRSELE